MKPIHLELATVSVPDERISFTFSADGETIYICDGATIKAVAIRDDWKTEIPLVGEPTGRKQRVVWEKKIAGGSSGSPVHIAVTACGTEINNEFDWGVELDAESERDEETEELAENKPLAKSELVVAGARSTLRLDPKTGNQLSQFATPKGGFDYLVAAIDADVVLATKTDGEVYFNDGDFGEWLQVGARVQPASTYEGRQSVAINAEGNSFIGLNGNKLTTIWMKSGKQSTSSITKNTLEETPVTVAWPDNGRNWCDESQLYYDAPQVEEGQPIRAKKIDKIIWRPVAIWPQRAGAYSPDTGMTVLGLRRLRNGKAMWCIWTRIPMSAVIPSRQSFSMTARWRSLLCLTENVPRSPFHATRRGWRIWTPLPSRQLCV